jgi:DNA-binding beta-propeller fold protein YncE
MINRRLILPALATVLGALAFATSPALAGEVHVYNSAFGSAGTLAGQFEDPAGVAVNSATGDVYVVDKGNNRIDEFEANGTFVRAWGWEVNGVPGFGECTLTCQAGTAGSGAGQLDAPEQIAVDNSGKPASEDPSVGDVYVTNVADDVIDKFSAQGAYLGLITTGAEGVPFTALYGVAVDPTGELWVSQQNGTATEQEDAQAELDDYSDALVNELLPGEIQAHLTDGGAIPGFAVDSDDDFYVAHAENVPEADGVARFNGAGEILPEPGDQKFPNGVRGEFIGALPQSQEDGDDNGPKTGVAVDLANDDVYLDSDGEARDPVRDVEELAADGSVIEIFGSEQLADQGGSGLAVDSSNGTVYVADDAAGEVWVYTTIPTPSVATGEASDLSTEGSATLNGTVDPDGKLEECKFEYFSEKAFDENFQNEVQTVTVAEEADGGGFTLTFKGDTTETIPYHATAVGVQFRLEALASVGAGNVEVTSAHSGLYTIEFKGALAHAKLPELIAESSPEEPLEPAGASVTAAIATAGGDGYEVAKTASCVPEASKITGSDEVPVDTNLGGLTPDSLYKYRLEAENEHGRTKGEYRTFVAPARPAISRGSLSDVGSSTATLSAQLNPGGALTSYRVEYGSSEAYGSSTPAVSAGAGLTSTPVQISLSGLQGGAVYYARIVASNEVAVAQGLPVTFTTGIAGGPSVSALPDDRAYELVSYFPSGTDEEAYVPAVQPEYIGLEEHGIKTGGQLFLVSSDGEAVVYAGDPPPTGGTGAVGESLGNEYLGRRGAGGGWTQADIQPPGAHGAMYEAFSSDLSVGIVQSGKEGGSLAADAPEGSVAGQREPYEDLYAHVTASGAGGEYDPLYTSAPPHRTPPRGSEPLSPGYAGANAGTSAVPAFSDLLFEANDALPTLNVKAAGGGGEDPATHLSFAKEENLYDSTAGGLYLVNVLPEGATEANASFGQFPSGNESDAHGLSHAISADGSRIFWTALEGGRLTRLPKALYVRENDSSPDDASTVQVDASTLPGTEREKAEKGGGGVFWAASSDGSKVFFTDCRKLTADSTAQPAPDCAEHGAAISPAGSDLYEYEVNGETGKPGRLTDLTMDSHFGETADVQGVVGSSEDGSYIYFVATGLLATAENAEGKKPVSGEDNLYLSHEGTTTFIGTLSPGDGREAPPLSGFAACSTLTNSEGCQGDWQADLGRRTAQVTPDGRDLVFMSGESLTGYDGLEEVFLYEAQSGALHCVSCNPSGEAPVPTNGKAEIGGFIPTSRSRAGEQPRVISEDGGRVFFDSGEPLVSTDTNGWLDVYEWERDGEGTCTETQGCVYDLSGGTDPEDSYLLGADASGANAFFISRADLVPADDGRDGDVVYDARVDGVQPPAAPACEGTGCQGVPPTPPIFATPASVTFNGVGNFPGGGAPNPPLVPKPKSLTRAQKLANALKACKKDKRKTKRQSCEKQAKQKYGPSKTKAKKSKKASKSNRRVQS